MTAGDRGVVCSPQWTAIYRHSKYPTREVVLNSTDKPPAKRDFHVPMAGNVAFTAVSITKLNEPKGGFKVAKTKGKKKRGKKKKEEEELEELEGLDDLDDEDEDDEEEPDVEEDEDEEDEEDDDEEDEEEEEEPKRKKKGKGKKSKKGKKRGPTGPREMPKGKLSAQDVAELAGTDARAVRLFLRKKANKKKWPKDKELGRYAFNKTEAKQIAKAMKTSKKEEEEEDDDE